MSTTASGGDDNSPVNNLWTSLNEEYIQWYWKYFEDNVWPLIKQYLYYDWIPLVLLIVIALINLIVVVFKSSGLNFIAVGANALKATIQDQPIDGDVTLFTIFDWCIENF